MLPDIQLEALRFFDRTALEGLKMHSRYLRDLVDHHKYTLPLRHIYEVEIAAGRASVELMERNAPRMRGQGFPEMLFPLVNNAYIHRLTFSVRRRNLRFLRYLRTNASKLQCRIGTLRIDNALTDIDTDIDYALVEFLGVHLKPQVYEIGLNEAWIHGFQLREDYAMLFTHNAFRRNVKHLAYDLSNVPAPDCIIRRLFGVDVVESCAIATSVDPSSWILTFIKMFEMAESGTDVVESVTLIHEHSEERSRMREFLEPLGHACRSLVPTPHSAFVEEWARKRHIFDYTVVEPTVADLFIFKNATVARQLEVFMWTLKQVDEDEQDSLSHLIFLLKVVGM